MSRIHFESLQPQRFVVNSTATSQLLNLHGRLPRLVLFLSGLADFAWPEWRGRTAPLRLRVNFFREKTSVNVTRYAEAELV